MTSYRSSDVAVDGGLLRVGCWESLDVAAGAPVRLGVLALHGITASHLSWAPVARSLTERGGVRMIAPDLRGRGRSATLPGPWGMPRHADDAAAAVAAFGLASVHVLGHSMGGFAAMVFGRRHPRLTSGIGLVDGGVPIVAPEGLDAEQALAATLGPAAQRLAMTFPSRSAYQSFWRGHPALANWWSEDIAAYVDYDLVGAVPELRSSCSFEAVKQDATELGSDGSLLDAWDNLAHELYFLRAPRGLLGERPGLYPPEVLARWQRRVPGFRWREVAGTNHYTLTLAGAGAGAVAAAVVAACHE